MTFNDIIDFLSGGGGGGGHTGAPDVSTGVHPTSSGGDIEL